MNLGMKFILNPRQVMSTSGSGEEPIKTVCSSGYIFDFSQTCYILDNARKRKKLIVLFKFYAEVNNVSQAEAE